MKYQKHSQRRYYFKISEPWNFKTPGGVVAERGVLSFPRKHSDNEDKRQFSCIDECNIWYQEKVADMETKQYKLLHDIKTKTAKQINEDEWQKIQSMMTNPENIKKDDIIVYHPELAHNFVDRDNERFSKGVLEAFVRTMPGKSVLLGHNWGASEEKDFVGRVFDAFLKEVSIDEMLKRVENHPNQNLEEHLRFIAERDGSINLLVTPFYILKDNKKLIRKIDAGIIKDISIGFRASDRIGVDEGEESSFDEYIDKGDSEGYELSFVFLGSQYGAQNRKTASKKKKDDNNDLSQKQGDSMKVELKSIDFSRTVTDENAGEAWTDIDEKFTSEIEQRDETIKSQKTLIDALGEDVTLEQVEQLKKDAASGAEYRKALIDSIVKSELALGILAEDEQAVADEKELLDNLETEKLRKKDDGLAGKVLNEHPPAGQFGQEPDEEKQAVSVPTAPIV